VILGVPPARLADRWRHLSDSGLAWVAAYPAAVTTAERTTALIEVDCAPGAVHTVAARLEIDQRVVTIEHVAPRKDLLLTVMTRTLDDLSELMLDELPGIKGIVSTQTHLAAHMYFEGSRWRLDALDSDQLTALEQISWHASSPSTVLASPALTPGVVSLARALSRDGRASAADLAATTDRPSSTVRRQLSALLASGSLTFRCDIAQPVTRWPLLAYFWCQAPDLQRDELLNLLRRNANVRLCLSLLGPTNFVVALWSESLTKIQATQIKLEECMPSVQVTDVSVALRARKRMGWLLRPDGRATGEVIPVAAL
jgi:DNA-binding Lrp family transcriptional regulator